MQCVVTSGPVEHVSAAIAGEGVVELRADEVLNTHERVEAGSHGVLSCQSEVDRDTCRCA